MTVHEYHALRILSEFRRDGFDNDDIRTVLHYVEDVLSRDEKFGRHVTPRPPDTNPR